MKSFIIGSLITVAAIIAACCGPMLHSLAPRIWVLNFDTPTKLTSVSDFENALNSVDRTETNVWIKKTPHAAAYHRPDLAKLPSIVPTASAPPQQYPKSSQGPNHDGLHVTQKVTLYDDETEEVVKMLIKYQ